MGLTRRTRIQNALVTLANSTDFHPVQYADDGTASTLDSTTVRPGIAIANEITARYERDKRDGRSLTRTKTSWVFQLIMRFECEVSLEEFEESLQDNPPVVQDDDGKQIALLEILGMDVIHPVQQNAENGTEAKINFEAFTGRG